MPPDLDTSLSIPASSSSHPSRPYHHSDSLEPLADAAGASSASLSRNISAGATKGTSKGTSHTAHKSGSGSGGISISKGAEQGHSTNNRNLALHQQLAAQLLTTPSPPQLRNSVGGATAAAAAGWRSGSSGVTTGRNSSSAGASTARGNSTGTRTGRSSSTAATTPGNLPQGVVGGGAVGPCPAGRTQDNGVPFTAGVQYPAARDSPSPSGLAAVHESLEREGSQGCEGAADLRSAARSERQHAHAAGATHACEHNAAGRLAERVRDQLVDAEQVHVRFQPAHHSSTATATGSTASIAVAGSSNIVLSPPQVPNLPPLPKLHQNQGQQQQRQQQQQPRSEGPLSHRAPLQGGAASSTGLGLNPSHARLRRASAGSQPRAQGAIAADCVHARMYARLRNPNHSWQTPPTKRAQSHDLSRRAFYVITHLLAPHSLPRTCIQ